MERTAQASPRVVVRLAGAFYLLTFATGSYALIDRSRVGVVAGMIAGASYIVVTLLFYGIFKPVSRRLSLLAAAVSLLGVVAGPLRVTSLNPLVFFGFYCLLIGYLILKSTFLPRFLGALMLFAALGWLTFLSPSLTTFLSPYNLAPGIIGEGVLTLWLLLVGVNVPRWQEQARTGQASLPGAS